jgi:hypothetical protein
MPSYWQLVISGAVQPQVGKAVRVLNSFGYRWLNDTEPPNQLIPVAVQIADFVWNPVASILPTSYGAGEVIWRNIWAPPYAPTVYSAAFIGGAQCDWLPNTAAVNVNLRTAERGSGLRGYKRIGPVCAAQVIGDELTADGYNAWQQAVSNFSQPFVLDLGGGQVYTAIPIIWERVRVSPGFEAATGRVADVVSQDVTLRVAVARHRRQRK